MVNGQLSTMNRSLRVHFCLDMLICGEQEMKGREEIRREVKSVRLLIRGAMNAKVQRVKAHLFSINLTNGL